MPPARIILLIAGRTLPWEVMNCALLEEAQPDILTTKGTLFATWPCPSGPHHCWTGSDRCCLSYFQANGGWLGEEAKWERAPCSVERLGGKESRAAGEKSALQADSTSATRAPQLGEHHFFGTPFPSSQVKRSKIKSGVVHIFVRRTI